MSHPIHHHFFGETIEERIDKVTRYLAFDRVYLWQIIFDGRDGFGLEGEALLTFIRRTVDGLFSRGVFVGLDGLGRQLPSKKLSEEIMARCTVWLNSGDPYLPWFAWFCPPMPTALWHLRNAIPDLVEEINTPLSYRHHYFGTPIDEWIENKIHKMDRFRSKNIESILYEGRDGFKLNDEALLAFARYNLEALFSCGATVSIDGIRRDSAIGTPEPLIEEIMARCTAWVNSGDSDFPEFARFYPPQPTAVERRLVHWTPQEPVAHEAPFIRRHRFFGETLDEWIERETNNLFRFKPMSLAFMVSEGGDGFGLEGEALLTFIRRTLEALSARGGVTAGLDGVKRVPLSAEIIEEIMARCTEWLTSGDPYLPVFARFYPPPQDATGPRVGPKKRGHEVKTASPFVRRHRDSGETIDEWIERKTNGITEFRSIGLETIISNGINGFGLEGGALLAFIRTSVEAFVAKGIEAHFDKDEDPLSHGNTPREIMEGIISRCATWLDSDEKILPYEKTLPSFVWFYLPENTAPLARVKQAIWIFCRKLFGVRH
jgi:hypothetical protein